MTDAYDPDAYVPAEFAAYVSRRWYECCVDIGLDMASAESFWCEMVRLDGTGIETYGSPSPSSQAEVDAAWPHYAALCRETLRDRRAEEYAEPRGLSIRASWDDRYDDDDD